MASKTQVLGLYKQMLEKASKFDNYNFREYAKRKVRDSFKQHRGEQDSSTIDNLYKSGVSELAIMARQSAISQMFTSDKLVVEPLKAHH